MYILHAFCLGVLCLLLVAYCLFGHFILGPFSFCLSLLGIVLCDINLVLPRHWRRRRWFLTTALYRSRRRAGFIVEPALALLFAASIFLFSLTQLLVAFPLLALGTLLCRLSSFGRCFDTERGKTFSHTLFSLLLDERRALFWSLV